MNIRSTFSTAAAAALLLVSVSAHAQIPQWKIDRERQVYSEFGIKLGGNFQQMNGYPFVPAYNPGGIAGVYVSKHGKTYGIKLEATVSTGAYKTADAASHSFVPTKDKPSDTVSKGDFTTLSVNVPLLLEIRPCKHFLFQFGPQYTHLLMTNDNNNAFKKAWNTDKIFKNDNYSLVFGVEEDITHGVKIGATFTESLSDVNNAAFAGISDRWQSTSAQVSLVIKLRKWYSNRNFN